MIHNLVRHTPASGPPDDRPARAPLGPSERPPRARPGWVCQTGVRPLSGAPECPLGRPRGSPRSAGLLCVAGCACVALSVSLRVRARVRVRVQYPLHTASL
jgi:hypothetical protein